jgi:N6-adenosine-specific RNA methylase IME4
MENDLVLVKLDIARNALVEAKTIQETKNILDVAVLAETYAKRQKLGDEAIHYATSIKVEALAQLGRMLKETVRADGGTAQKTRYEKDTELEPPTLAEMGLDKKTSKLAQDIASLPDEQLEMIKSGVMAISRATTEAKRIDVIDHLESIKAREVKELSGVYDVIVIDPPWDMKKIERDVAPNQVEFDYPTMTDEQILNICLPMASDCHVWLWTTHKKLPFAFDLLKAWNLKYVCTFTWHKPGGFQPFGLPQYNCEFALYARHGSPIFTDTKDFMVCFDAPRKAHSEKPVGFYDVIRRVTSGRRLDMFNRSPIYGFDVWGNESK